VTDEDRQRLIVGQAEVPGADGRVGQRLTALEEGGIGVGELSHVGEEGGSTRIPTSGEGW